MGAEHLPQLLVATLVDQVQVDLAERGEVAVRVVGGVRRVAGVGHLQAVVGHVGHVEDADPDAAVLVLERDGGAAVDHGDGLGERAQRADRHRAVVDVRTEDGVRVAVASLDDEVEGRGVDGQPGAGRLGGLAGSAHAGFASGVKSSASWCVSRPIAPSGIDSHVGRLRAS